MFIPEQFFLVSDIILLPAVTLCDSGEEQLSPHLSYAMLLPLSLLDM